MRDRGSAPLMVVGVVAILLGFMLSLAVADVAVQKARATAAADLAALAAVSEGCGAAQLIAAAHEIALESCSLEGVDVRVVVSQRFMGIIQRLTGHGKDRFTATAVAGPADIS